MNASAKWVRRALLGGVAFGAMATGAQAGELSSLKAQLEALQSRVNQLEATGPAASSSLPEGASYISFRRGSDLYTVDGPRNRGGEETSPDRGFTIAITPTADLPAPVMEVSVSGYVKGDLIYDTHNDLGHSADPGKIVLGKGDDENFRAQALQSRFRIKSKSDTAVGQIRTLIETDFRGKGEDLNLLRLRHAWGEWDLTPDLTFGAGQTWATHYHFAGEIPTVDFGGLLGTSGYNASRVAQVQLKSASGPFSWAVGVQNPRSEITGGDDNQLPDLAAKVNMEFGGASIGLSGIVSQIHLDKDDKGNAGGMAKDDSELGWGLSAGVDLPIGDMFSLHGTIGYGDGNTSTSGSPAPGAIRTSSGKIKTNKSLGFAVGTRFKISEESSINAAYSYASAGNKNLYRPGDKTYQKIHVNYLWQPVSKLRMGFEGIYSWRHKGKPYGKKSGYGSYSTASSYKGYSGKDHNLRFQFGTWFFF